MNNMKKVTAIALAAGAIGIAFMPATASAAGFYIGADVARLSTELDYGFSEEYDTQHVRVKAGYEFADFIAIEGHVYTSNDDDDIDINGDRFSFDTGNIIGVYAKPKTNFAKANVYGLVGLSIWDTTYTILTGVFATSRDTDSVVMLGFGVGGEFNITKNLRFNIEGMLHVGSADYNTFFADSVDMYSLGLAAGMSYKF